MNKKGFTTVELILTISLVIIIMGTITSVTFVYRDRADYEENITKINTYKNSLTKIIYDDILNPNDPVISINKSDEYNYVLFTFYNNSIPLQIIEESNKVGILYNDMEYIIPDSDTGAIEVKEIKYSSPDNNIYALDITFSSLITEDFTIHFMVS